MLLTYYGSKLGEIMSMSLLIISMLLFVLKRILRLSEDRHHCRSKGA